MIFNKKFITAFVFCFAVFIFPADVFAVYSFPTPHSSNGGYDSWFMHQQDNGASVGLCYWNASTYPHFDFQEDGTGLMRYGVSYGSNCQEWWLYTVSTTSWAGPYYNVNQYIPKIASGVDECPALLSSTDIYSEGGYSYSGYLDCSNGPNLPAVDDQILFDQYTGAESGDIAIIYPANDEDVNGSAFVIELDYWNFGATSAPYDQMYYQITDYDLNAIAMGFEDVSIDNVEEEKTVYISEIVLGSFPNAILTVALYNSTTQAISDSENQTFNIYTTGATEQYYNYALNFIYQMDYDKFHQPSKTYDNTNNQEIVVSAKIGDILCDDIVEGYFAYNLYTDATFTTIASAGTINRFVKGGFYGDCQFNEVHLYLRAVPANPGPVYYQLDFYDDTGQTDKVSFLRFAIFYDAVDGEVGGIEWQDPNQNFFCDDLTIYLPNYIGDPFEIKILNKICAFIIPPPNYFSDQVGRINSIFRQKIAFIFMIQIKYNSVSTAIASGSTNPPEMTSGSWHGASFNLQDMFSGSTSFMPWVRTYMGVVMWFAFIVWLLRDVRKSFFHKDVLIND